MAALFYYMDPLVHPLRLWETFGDENPLTKYFQVVCMYSQKLCNLGIQTVADANVEPHDRERVKVYFGHYPSGSSIRAWQHIH